jgi:hypothetical protein
LAVQKDLSLLEDNKLQVELAPEHQTSKIRYTSKRSVCDNEIRRRLSHYWGPMVPQMDQNFHSFLSLSLSLFPAISHKLESMRASIESRPGLEYTSSGCEKPARLDSSTKIPSRARPGNESKQGRHGTI